MKIWIGGLSQMIDHLKTAKYSAKHAKRDTLAAYSYAEGGDWNSAISLQGIANHFWVQTFISMLEWFNSKSLPKPDRVTVLEEQIAWLKGELEQTQKKIARVSSGFAYTTGRAR